MSGMLLFARSRHWLGGTIVAAASAILVLVCGPIGYALNPDAGYRVAVAAQIPLLSALVIQASIGGRPASAESYPVRSMRALRLLHVIIMTLVSCVALGVAAVSLIPADESLVNGFADLGPIAIIRNTLALTGAALIGGALFGAGFGWLLPLAWATLPYLVTPSLEADTTGIATLIMRGDDDFWAFIVAISCWVVGAALAQRNWCVVTSMPLLGKP